MMSLVLHAAVLLVVGYTWRWTPRGAAVEPDRTAGIVLVRQQDGQREYFDRQDESPSQDLVQPQMDRDHVLPTLEENPVDLARVLPTTRDAIGSGGASGLPSANELIRGAGPGRITGGTTRTEVFGLAGEGTRFVYVFDRSGSMNGFGGRPLAAAKAELLASLGDLDRIHQFQVIFYNEEPRIFNPDGQTPRLVWGDEAGKEKARRFISSMVADGGTRHLRALQLALGMSPDVIFFLTDADEPRLSAEELAMVRRMNRGTVINAIEFGFGPRRSGESFLVQLARQNSGRHAYVDVSLLNTSR